MYFLRLEEFKKDAIVHFTVVCLVAKPLNRSEARVDFVVIQTLLLFICKSLCYHANVVSRLCHFKVAFIQRLSYMYISQNCKMVCYAKFSSEKA